VRPAADRFDQTGGDAIRCLRRRGRPVGLEIATANAADFKLLRTTLEAS
jgi:hypothetical protein